MNSERELRAPDIAAGAANDAGHDAGRGVRPAASSGVPLRDTVRRAIHGYFDSLDGADADNLYDLVLTQIEPPLLEAVLERTGNNQSLTARILGLNRGTLRKKMKRYGLLDDPS